MPIVAITAHAMTGAHEQYLAAGMNDYISKPFERDQFLATVKRWIRPATGAAPAAEAAAPAVSSAAEMPAFDEGPLVRLSIEAPESEFRELIDTYLAGAAELLASAEAAAAGHDLGALAKAAHDLVSTSGNFGVPRLQALARSIEEACKVGNSSLAFDMTSRLRPEAERAWSALRRRFVGPATPDAQNPPRSRERRP